MQNNNLLYIYIVEKENNVVNQVISLGNVGGHSHFNMSTVAQCLELWFCLKQMRVSIYLRTFWVVSL